MRVTTQAQSIDFLLDGEDFFAKLHKSILMTEMQSKAMLDANPHAEKDKFIKMAYWKADPDLRLPAVEVTFGPDTVQRPETRLIDALQNACYQGVNIQVLLWNAWKTECWFPGRQFDSRVRTIQNANRTQREGDFFLKKHNYRGYIMHPATSLHLKIAAFSRDDGGPEVLLGGLNLGEAYKSNKVHDTQNNWHDAAIAIRGEAANVIETFVDNLWAEPQPAQGPENLNVMPALAEPLNVKVLTTDMRWGARAERDIRIEVVNAINDAKKYVYLENQALTDPAIIDALIAARARGVEIIAVVPHPKQTMLGDYSGYAYVMGFAYRAIGLANMKSFKYEGKVYGKWTITASELTQASLAYRDNLYLSNRPLDISTECFDVTTQQLSERSDQNKKSIVNTEERLRRGEDSIASNITSPVKPFRPASQFMNRFVSWRGADPSGNGSVYLSKITDIETKTSSFYAPRLEGTKGQSPYVHSKIIFVDDKIAFIGTSNWTYRSMQFDAEMSLMINNPDKVQQIRKALFDHWGMGNIKFDSAPSSFYDKAKSNKNLINSGHESYRGKVNLVPLDLNDFAVSPLSGNAWGAWAAGNQI